MKTSQTPHAIPSPFGRYAHVVHIEAVAAGVNIVRTSGQLAIDGEGVIPSSVEAQAQLIFSHIDAILAQAGMGVNDIAHITAYVTERAHMRSYMSARDAYLKDIAEAALPASTLLIVSGFTRPEFLVEIEVMAVG